MLLCAGIVFNITGGKDLTLQEVNRVSEVRGGGLRMRGRGGSGYDITR